MSHAQLSNFPSSVLWSSVRCNSSSEKQPRPGPQNTHKGQGPKDTLRVIAVSAVCQRWSPGLIGGALIALQIKPSVSVQRSVSCLFACFCCSALTPGAPTPAPTFFRNLLKYKGLLSTTSYGWNLLSAGAALRSQCNSVRQAKKPRRFVWGKNSEHKNCKQLLSVE